MGGGDNVSVGGGGGNQYRGSINLCVILGGRGGGVNTRLGCSGITRRMAVEGGGASRLFSFSRGGTPILMGTPPPPPLLYFFYPTMPPWWLTSYNVLCPLFSHRGGGGVPPG